MNLLVNRHTPLRFVLAFGFLLCIPLFINLFFHVGTTGATLVIAAVFSGYMALNIGANDAANNLGPAVGAKAIPLTGALMIAFIFEAAGALIAGGDVVTTIKAEIIDPELIRDQRDFVWLMLSALLAAALCVHLATALGAPVSTTHAIIGAIVGAGITLGGTGIVNWSKLATIASSWLFSPLLSGLIAALFLYLIKRLVTYQADMTKAAKRIVPLLMAAMCWAFTIYLILKGFKQIVQVDFQTTLITSFVISVGFYLIIKPAIIQVADRLPQNKANINKMFNLPLLFAAALFSFSHGANDVANTIGPLVAIHEVMLGFGVTQQIAMPLWALLIGAIGISIGLVLYGSRLIRIVGSEITELDQMRAYCIAMAVFITIILASQFGLPVSTTHTAVGAIFGVGFLREYLKRTHNKMLGRIERHPELQDKNKHRAFLKKFKQSTKQEKAEMLQTLDIQAKVGLSKQKTKPLSKLYQRELVKRSILWKIISIWMLTIPLSALIAASIYSLIKIAVSA